MGARILQWAPRVTTGSLWALLLLLPFSKAAIEITFPIFLVSWLLAHWRTRWASSVWRTPAGRWCAITWAAYVAACALSILTSTHADLSVRGFIGKTLEYALLFVLAADAVQAPGVAARGVQLILLSAALVCGDAIAQELTHWELVYGRTPWRVYSRMTGPYENPIDLATYLVVVVPIIVVQLSHATRRSRWWLWALLAVVMAGVIRTESQGAWLSLAVGLGVLVVWGRRLRAPAMALGLGLVVSASLYLYVVGRLDYTVTFHDIGTRDRWFMWQSAWHMIQDRPWLGQGLNTFMANYLSYWVGGERQPRYAHNCFLQVTAETGVIGLVTFVGFLAAMVWSWWRVLRRFEFEAPERRFILALGAGMVGFLFQAAFDTNLYSLRQATLFWTLAGMATGLSLKALSERPSFPRAS
ncbi:MAG: O-antigen ligase family protein [Candidatus Omnitrophica bacterium]|nr:O-antigen ligase family protein [Candidatus Omnitrophota bacterium]